MIPSGSGGKSEHRGNPRIRHAQWNTPKELFDELDREFKFDFDPCPEGEIFGLEKVWGKSNFVNPPYGRPIVEWLEKGIQEWRDGKTCVFLLPARTDTRWFHEFLLPLASEIRFIRRRIRFVRHDGKRGSAPFPSMLVIFRPGPPQGATARTANPEDIFLAIKAERARQDRKWGEQNHNPAFWFPIFIEELGEAAEAYLGGSALKYVEELTQAAAVLLAMIETVLRNPGSFNFSGAVGGIEKLARDEEGRMNVLEIIKAYLKEHGAEGLCGEDCGCDIDDLPCAFNSGIPTDCVPARKKIATQEDIDEENGSGFEVGDTIYVPVEE